MIQFGIDPRNFVKAVIAIPRFLSTLYFFIIKSKEIPIRALNPQFLDYSESSGIASGHYFHQDIIVARWIYEESPKRHVDIASRVDGFVAHLAVFREVEVFDIRQLKTNEPNIIFKQHDFMTSNNLIPALESVSCLHSIEHFGLGRYGDPLDINGHLKGFSNIARMLKPGGVFYFSVPLGTLRVEFNAHRVFSVKYIIERFITPNDLDVEKCTVIDDQSNILLDIDINSGIETNFNCEYGVILLKLKKIMTCAK